MKMIVFVALFAASATAACAGRPSESAVKSCLIGHAADSTVSIQSLDRHEIVEQDDYADGFDAPYTFRYQGKDAGYALGKTDQALIYQGNLYRLSKAITLGDSLGAKPGAFTPTLADWNVATEGKRQYFCVGFNFDGLGQSGNFQKVREGYLLDVQTRALYYAVRYIR